MTAKELTKKLLIKYNIFIKDLTKKTGGQNYIRIAIRNTEDNDKLVKAMKELLN
jgi:histidinol-phosphate/aromatic aminotransferase/cobyric acid decarboxylase-like protein